jgi:hypothetical protein
VKRLALVLLLELLILLVAVAVHRECLWHHGACAPGSAE